MTAISKTRRQRDEVGKVAATRRPRSFAKLCRPSTTPCPLSAYVKVRVFDRCWLLPVENSSGLNHEISSPFEGELESLKRLCVIEYRVKAAVIVMIFCVFVRPSLRRVIKYSDEYQFGLVWRNLKY